MPRKVDKEQCLSCGACIDVCPVGALSQDTDGKTVCDAGACIDCGGCESVCPVGAISQE